MAANEKFGPMRKGLLEFLILKVIDADRVYVADILRKLADTEFATQEGTLYPLLVRLERLGWLRSKSDPAGGARRLSETCQRPARRHRRGRRYGRPGG